MKLGRNATTDPHEQLAKTGEKNLLLLLLLLFRALDVSKQLVGGIVVHSLNVMASYFSGGSLEGQQANPCVW